MKIQYQNNGITVFESALYRTTSTVIDLGEAVLIVDPNWLPEEVHFIRNFVANVYHEKKQFLLFTHSDYDHIIGYGMFPDAIIIASAYFIKNNRKDEIIQQIKDFDHHFYITRDYPITYPNVDIVISHDGQTLDIGNTSVIFYNALGHVADGLFAILPEKKCWIGGDYLSNIEIPMIDHQYEAYTVTLNKARKLAHTLKDTQLYIPGHGDCAKSISELLKRITNDQNYLQLLVSIRDERNQNKNNYDKLMLLIHTYSDNPEMLKIHQNNLAV